MLIQEINRFGPISVTRFISPYKGMENLYFLLASLKETLSRPFSFWRSALMQPQQTSFASRMPCSVSGCLRRCLRGTSLADQLVLNGATPDRRTGAKNKTASASLASFGTALCGADKAATLLRISPRGQVSDVGLACHHELNGATTWYLSLSRHEIQWPS